MAENSKGKNFQGINNKYLTMAGTSTKDMSGTDNELFYLKWHNFQKNVSKQFERLREDDDLVDITFACDGQQIRAHKLVLFACSPYFKQLLKV